MRKPDVKTPWRRCLFRGMRGMSAVMTVLSLLALVAVIVFVFIDGAGKVTPHFIFGSYTQKDPTLLPALAGTFLLVLISCAIAVPLGIAGAIFLAEYTNGEGTLVRIVRVAAETLAGVPSIVYGLFGYLVFVVALGWGYTLLGGGITLAVMILPVIIRSTEESLRSVPVSFREGAYALGTGKVRTIFLVVLPAAASGIVTAVILAIGRVVSESAVLILTIGMIVNRMPTGILSSGTSLALNIYYFYQQGLTDQAAATSVVLLFLVFIINLLAGGIGKLLAGKAGKSK